MKGNRSKLYNSSDDFFELEGNAVMKLTSNAAQEACKRAIEYNVVVVRVEGGIWHNPGFEARLDCIWDGIDPPIAKSEAVVNNSKALKFIIEESNLHDAFIITTAPLTGYTHKLFESVTRNPQ